MSHRTSKQRRTWRERALSLLLAAALVAGLTPGLTLPASAEHWADAYLDQLVDWGVMRADQTANPDAELTRAEFFAVINRAYGYTEPGYIPFEDVLPTDWFYDDISIAYTAGYMAGTSDTTASPNQPLTREQAFCILGRNMMLKDSPGESLAFADSRDISDWARGTIKAAADNYIVSGYPDNTLHPQDSISKGQMAVLVTQCLGTPIRESGTYDLGGVFGNVTITAPNVTLRNATISGDLYISGGVGLGGIKLENVDVLGRIIVSGTGESEGGDASVIMRNVTADEMLVDNMRNKTVTIRADGITDIAKTVVRTNAYLEDNNTDDKGLMRIEVDGDPGLRLTLAGRIKEVVNKTPSSYIQAAKGTVAKLTVDEAATNSIVQIDRNTKISVVNLDVATNVIGEGDIGQLNVNAPGSVVTMLPDKIYIRPGLNANIAGVIMDYQAAEEGSLDPRLLAGYPAAKDIAPTGFRADFAGNKKGTIYWAVSYVSDGSIGEEDLVSPPSYGSKAIANGSVEEPAGGEEVSAQVGNLVVGGSYYLSAILVDEQKERSPVKVISFSTPDNTVPAFAQGYPQMSRISSKIGETLVTVMPTKSCKLYYALLPQGAQTPTPNELRAAAVSGNLGYGVRDVIKNTESVFPVNNQALEELKTYVLYLWLIDADGTNSSAVTSLAFTVPDETPPEFLVHPYMNGNPQATSVPMAATVNENATIFWAIVEEGAAYPLPNNNSDPLWKDNEIVDGKVVSSKLTSDYAKLCVTNGMGALQRGQVAAQANTEVSFTIGGLQPEKAYDFYYLARDAAGNNTVQVYKLDGGLHTLDQTGPVITQRFSAVPSPEDAPDSPLASTDIYLDFSENICNYYDANVSSNDFLSLYNNRTQVGGKEMFSKTLAASIVLYHFAPDTQESERVQVWEGTPGAADEPSAWVNYNNVIIRAVEDGHIEVIFPGIDSTNPAAVKLSNGEWYYFQFQNLTDTSTAHNQVSQYYNDQFNYKSPGADAHHIPLFQTVFSQVMMRSWVVDDLPKWRKGKEGNESGQLPSDKTLARADATFRLSPQSTKNTNPSNRVDILIYSLDTYIDFDLYYRITLKDGTPIKGDALKNYVDNLLPNYNSPDYDPADKTKGADENGWFFLGSTPDSVLRGRGVSVGRAFGGCEQSNTRDYLRLQNFSEDLHYEFVVSITRDGVQTEYDKFEDSITLDIYVEAGQLKPIHDLAGDPTKRATYEGNAEKKPDEAVTNIGQNLSDVNGAKHLEYPITFSNANAPQFRERTPKFYINGIKEQKTETVKVGSNDAYRSETYLVGATTAYLDVNLDMAGTIYYVVSDTLVGAVPELRDGNGNQLSVEQTWSAIPSDGSKPQPREQTPPLTLRSPDAPLIDELVTKQSKAVAATGTEPYETPRTDHYFEISGLTPNTEYYIYFMLENGNKRSDVYVYKFKTMESFKPRIRLIDNSSVDGTVSVDTKGNSLDQRVESNLSWVVFTSSDGNEILNKEFQTFLTKTTDGGYTDANGIAMNGYFTGENRITTWYQALTTPFSAERAYGVLGDLPTGAEFSKDRWDGYTVFDVLASEGNRSGLQDYINRSMGYPRTNYGTVSTNIRNGYVDGAPWVTDAIAKAPDNGDTYLFLIAGHNVGSEDGTTAEYLINSFAVLDPISYTNRDAPMLETVDGNPGGDPNPNSSTVSYTGTVTLRFDKDLYWSQKSDSNTYYRVVNGNNGPNDTAKTVGLEYDVTPKPASGTYGLSISGRAISIDLSKLTKDSEYFSIMSDLGRIATLNGGRADSVSVRVNQSKGIDVGPTGSSQYYCRVTVVVEYKGNGQTITFPTVEGVTWGGVVPPTDTLAVTAPELATVSTANTSVTSAGSYSMDLSLTFDQPLYTKTKDAVTAVSGTKLATNSTVNYTPQKSNGTMESIKSVGSGTTYTLTLKNVKPGVIVLPSQTFYDATGQASTTGSIKIKIEEVQNKNNQSGAPIMTPQVTVSFGDFEQTNPLSVKK